jgi:uncharacterized protein (DUF1800 family)
MTLQPGPWAPFQPTAADPWDLRKVAHLHRRAGFGAAWADLHRDLHAGPAASVARFLKPRPVTADEQQVLDSLRQGVLDSGDAERLKAWWLYRILYGPDPLREKLTLFWHGHFATSNGKVNNIGHMLAQNELFRKHALGNFGDLANAVVGDPAMLVWLDGADNKKEKPNENFAREFQELFTLGVGHYTEEDVRAAARAFTGWQLKDGKPAYNSAQHDGGVKTYHGHTGPWGGKDVVRITLAQPACALFLCRKLYRFLVSETHEPPPELLQPLADELCGHRYSIAHVVGIILRSRHFYAATAYRQRVKCPVEYSAGMLRTLEVSRVDNPNLLLALAVTCERQGKDLFYPPNVKGWDGGRTWLNSTTVLERGNWASDIVWGNADLGLKAYDPVVWAKQNGIDAGKAAAALLRLLLQDELTPQARELILAAGRDGKADELRRAVQLMMHCPEYQLA